MGEVNEPMAVDAQLHELRRITEVGLAKVDGRLEVLTERDRTAATAQEQQARQLSMLEGRVDALDRRLARSAGIAIGASGVLSTATSLVVWAVSRR